jgi:hypothetical protein
VAELKKGDKVRWRSGGGGRASGTVERVITSKVKVAGRSVSGTKKEPRYLVRNADTGKAVVLKRPSLQKSGGRGAARKGGKAPAKAAPKRAAAGTRRRAAAKPKPEPPPPAATAAEAEQKTQILKSPPPKWPRWAAAGGLVAAVLVIGVLFLANDDDDDGGDDAESAATVETTTATTTTAAEPTPELIAALESRPLALSGIETIPADRLGDDQENLTRQFNAAYDRVLAGLSELEEASADNAEISALATYVSDEVEIERAITDAFVRDSFSEGDPASVLAEKTARTERTLQRQMSASEALEAPPEASDLQAALTAAREANRTYLEDIAAAIDSGDQAGLDAALREGRAASARAGRRIAAAARALQDETQASVSG